MLVHYERRDAMFYSNDNYKNSQGNYNYAGNRQENDQNYNYQNLQQENRQWNHCNNHKNNSCQTHVHEYEGSTRIAEQNVDAHNHRFAGVTSQAIPYGNSHVHRLLGNSDFYENHHHEVGAVTGPAIPVGSGRHVHFVYGTTTMDDGHVHQFIFATLIENPIGD